MNNDDTITYWTIDDIIKGEWHYLARFDSEQTAKRRASQLEQNYPDTSFRITKHAKKWVCDTQVVYETPQKVEEPDRSMTFDEYIVEQFLEPNSKWNPVYITDGYERALEQYNLLGARSPKKLYRIIKRTQTRTIIKTEQVVTGPVVDKQPNTEPLETFVIEKKRVILGSRDVSMKYLSRSRINSAIREFHLVIVRGEGYCYFLDRDTGTQVGDSVMVCYLWQLSLEQWKNEAREARNGAVRTVLPSQVIEAARIGS
jgi:hypothetical protein